MMKESVSGVRWRFLASCLFLIFAVSCGSKEEFTGIYKATGGDSPKQAEMEIELKANGVGIWRMSDEEVPFAWYIKGSELRVHTRGGGVIVGAMEKDSIHITLPGASKTTVFKRNL